MERRQEQLTRQFYDWELRGRGWMLFDTPVELECEYHPFFAHRIPMTYRDDGLRHTVLSSLAQLFRTPKHVSAIEAPELPPITAFVSEDTDLRMLTISWKHGTQVKPDRMELVFASLVQLTPRLSFELIATYERISIQLACIAEDIDLIKAHLSVYLPEVMLKEEDNVTLFEEHQTYIVDYGLQHEFMRPLSPFRSEHDWYVGLCATLDLLQDGEQTIIQVLFSGTVNAWNDSIMRAVTINGKESFFIDSPEMPALAQQKTEHSLVAATVRVCVQAPNAHRARILFDHVSAALISASESPHNALTPLGNPEYGLESRALDMIRRRSHRLGMLLNVRELANLAHLPSANVRSRKLFQPTKTTKPPPPQSGTYCIGINEHEGVETPVHLSEDMRSQHIHIIGATGTGKSTLFHSLICQDIIAGNGFAVLDPHGDLIEHILPYIPQHRVSDVLIIDPSDVGYPVGFNLLHAHSELEKQLLASDLVALFRRFASSWGDQMNSVLANCILAFLDSTEGGTLIDLRRFLIEKPYREKFLDTVQDDAIVYYWRHEFPLLKGGSLGSILTRLDAFLRPKVIRNMVSQKTSFNVEELMRTKKIVLVKLAQGLIGEENGYLLGACIVAKIQQAAMARQAAAKEERTPFYLYIDEFHHFITPSLSNILTGARKYGLGLIVAHQDMEQVSGHNAELASSLIANAGTRICFRLGDADAKKLAAGFASFGVEDLQNLGRGEAIMRIGRAQDDCNVRVMPVHEGDAFGLEDRVIADSRKTYTTKQEQTVDTPAPARDKHIPTQAHTTESVQQPAVGPPSIQPIQEERTKAQLVERIERKKHRYWQQVIKKLAEERGYKADIELPVLDGSGMVDVSLMREGGSIAVEISVSTTPAWELHNIQKCLTAGYGMVIAASENDQTLQQLREHVRANCTEAEQQRIVITNLAHIGQYIPMQEFPAAEEQAIKGYRVSVTYGKLETEEHRQKQKMVSNIIKKGKPKSL